MTDTTTFGWTHDNVSIGLSSNGTGDIPSFVASNISQDIQEGNITVTPILNGCIGTAETVTITVNPISTVNAVSDTVCSGEIVPQIDFTGNNSSSVYTWVNDNNSIGLGQTGIGFIPAFVAENLGTTTQDATIVITPSVNGCPGINDTIHIVVYELISPTPDPTRPIAALSLIQSYWFIAIFPVKVISDEDCSAQYSKSPIGSTIGVGYTTI